MMFDAGALNEEKIPPVLFERGYELTPTVYKEVLETKVLQWNKKITKKSVASSSRTERRHTRQRLYTTDWTLT